jgi:large subunit ribosomal protein L4
MKLEIYKSNGTATGRSIELPSEVFGIEPNNHAIYLDVKQYLANQRQGTHATKERSQMSGSTRKLGKQKGGGGARRGSIKSHVMVGGARAFGPKPHEYGFKLNKKVKHLARISALTHKAVANNIVIVEDFDIATPKTKEYVAMLKNLKMDNVRSLMILEGYNKNLLLSSRNIPKTAIITAGDINTYAIMKAGKIIVSEGAVKALSVNND